MIKLPLSPEILNIFALGRVKKRVFHNPSIPAKGYKQKKLLQQYNFTLGNMFG